MSDDKNEVPGPDPSQPDSAEPDSIEAEIGDLLAEAEALTSELSGEIGEGEEEAARESDFFESESDSEASLDQQVHDAEQALSTVADELGAEKPSKPTQALKLPAAKAITLPTSSPKKSPPEKKPAEKAALKLPSRSSPARGSSAKAQALVAAKTPEPVIETKVPTGPSRAVRCKQALVAVGSRFEPVGRVACRVLDTLDRPFAKVQFTARILMGWLSLAFVVAAISLWLFAVR